MNIRKKTNLSTALALALGLGAASNAAAESHRLVVDLKPNADVATLVDTLESRGVRVMNYVPEIAMLAIEVDASLAAHAAELSKLPGIAGYELDVVRYAPVVKADKSMDANAFQNMVVDGEIVPWGIQAVQADQVVATANTAKVCVIDSGYDFGHPDLPTVGVTGDSEGAGPWDNSDGAGLHYHGTHVAGTIAAKGHNQQGVVGVIANGNVNLHIVRTFNAAGGWVYASDLAGAMRDCATAGAKVINMSLGSSFESGPERRMVKKLANEGILLIAAAGNGGAASHHYPASYPEVLSVAAVDNTLTQASFSQRNSQVDIAAPGVAVASTAPRGTKVTGGTADYVTASGTSMASPHVAGVAALVWGYAPNCSNFQIAEALQATALDGGAAGWDYRYGFGTVQAKAAIDYLQANTCRGGR